MFHSDGTPRKEDDLIAYCWDKFLDTGDATWLPRLPMVKSVVKAMDCIQAWSKKEGIPVEKFIVAGGSKRGWTTWMTGATDDRVEAIMPIVIDVLNLDEQLTHHGATYGFWSKALGDYVRHGIVQNPEHERMQDLHAIEDPHSYLDRLTLPKFIINGTVFFLIYYLALPVLVGYFPALMKTKVLGQVNIAYLFALSQFFMAWIMAFLYVRVAAGWDKEAAAVIASETKH